MIFFDVANKLLDKNIIRILKNGGIGVLPTDTLYGFVGSAASKKAVSRLYKVRGRNAKKPMIVLIASIGDLDRFGVSFGHRTKTLLKKIWPGPVSVILPCAAKKFAYLHRGTNTLAFRLPRDSRLLGLLRKTGPLVAPSANPEGKSPARTVREAGKYFGSKADFYVHGGVLEAPPSSLIEVKR